MKHIRSIDVEQPVITLEYGSDTEDALIVEELDAGRRFFRGVFIGLALCAPIHVGLIYLIFGS